MLEAKQLWRAVGIPVAIGLSVFVAVVRVQEPPFMRRFGIDYLWSSVDGAVALSVCSLPLVWAMCRTRAARTWTERLTVRPLRATIDSWLGIVAVAACLAGVGALTAITLDSIYATPSVGRALLAWIKALLVAAPLAALAPVLARLAWSAPATAAIWVLILATSCGAIGPELPTPLGSVLSVTALGELGSRHIVATLCATVAGLLLSSISSARDGAAGANTTKCESASSATFTATSKR